MNITHVARWFLLWAMVLVGAVAPAGPVMAQDESFSSYWKLTFDLRYHWGLSNNLGSRQFNGEPNAGLKNANWEISVGFKLF